MTVESKRPDLWIVLGLLVLAAVPRLVWLGADDFWSDEVHTFDAVALPTAELVRERLAAGHLPVYFLLLDLWSDVLGRSEWALRLPSAIAGTLCVLPAWGLLRRLLPDRGTAAWGTALVVSHPLWIELSREARMYPLLALAFLVVAVAVVDGVREARSVSPLAWCAAVVGPMLHVSWGFGLVALGGYAATSALRRDSETRVPRRLWLLLGLSGLVLLLGVSGAQVPSHDLVRRPWPREVGVFLLRQVAGADVRPAWLPLYAGTALAWGVALVTGARAAPPSVRRLGLSLVLGVHGAAAAGGLLTTAAWGPARYVSLAVPGMVLLAANGRLRLRLLPALVALSLTTASVGVLDVDRSASTIADTESLEAPSEDPPTTAPERARRLVLEHYRRHPRSDR